MKTYYSAPEIEILEMALEQPVLTGSDEEPGDSPFWEPGEDF